jgi:hypothetical protein
MKRKNGGKVTAKLAISAIEDGNGGEYIEEQRLSVPAKEKQRGKETHDLVVGGSRVVDDELVGSGLDDALLLKL